ncbi:MAG: sterol desaturase family protein [Thalassotalea sp.]|nr:sterol desaturase family protein [Thalassotalea sp.]
MRVELLLLLLSPIFLLFILFEFIRFKKYYSVKDSISNTVLALFHQGADALSLIILMPLFYKLHSFAIVKIELSITTIFLAFLLQDFLYYWFHRASHNIHWLWAAHIVHHSSDKMNFTTAFRQSLMYPLAGMWIFWTPMILLGFDPKFAFTVVALNLAFQFFVHTQSVNKLGWLERIFNTPSHHRVHHATNKLYIDKNYAGVLIIWDKLFNTYQCEDSTIKIKYGILGKLPSVNSIDINFHQWLFMFRGLIKAKNTAEKLKVLFGYPSHENTHQQSKNK